eukprot:scaffold1661_cov251-Pinguiococcus_pyrenoidosus.AAC.1
MEEQPSKIFLRVSSAPLNGVCSVGFPPYAPAFPVYPTQSSLLCATSLLPYQLKAAPSPP